MTKKEIADIRAKVDMSCTTVATMRELVIAVCDELRKADDLAAFFVLENYLYGEGRDKPLEIKAAMEWGALWVVQESGKIDWNTMREMFGEFMSKQMEFR